jgi:hypothetical protein
MSGLQPVVSAVVATLVAVLLPLPSTARAGERPIQDNSFLIEEAYNQEAGVIQHISALTRSMRTGEWVYSFTEEWPVLSQTHQASVTLNFLGLQPGTAGIGDVALNYRWQAVGNGDSSVALAPRLSVILPTGNAALGLGSGSPGIQVNLPMSVALSEQFVAHTNLGGTYLPSARAVAGGQGALSSFSIGQSLIWLAAQNLNFLAETVYWASEFVGPRGAERASALTIAPGVRAALDLPGGLQIVPGISVPIGIGPSRGETAIFFYLSLEHPFRPAGETDEEKTVRMAANTRSADSAM